MAENDVSKKLPQTGHLMLAGVVSIALGVIAIGTPAVAGTAVVYVIGGILLVAGIVQAVQGLRADSWSGKLLPLVLGVVTSLCGLGVLAHPLVGLSFLTLLLVAFFVIEGVCKIVASFSYRPASGWLLMLASGVLALVLGVLIWQQWPVSGLWAVGILVGVDLLTTGISLVALATTIRRLKRVPGSLGMGGAPHGSAT